MMKVGVRELRENTSELLRRVREEGETVEITYYGKVVARLVPVKRGQLTDEEIDAMFADLDALSAELKDLWPKGVSAVDAINDVRRDLGSPDYWRNQVVPCVRA